MKFYQLTVQLKTNQTISVIRELKEESIDLLYTVYEMKARKAYGSRLLAFNIGMVSRHCKPVQEFLRSREQKALPHDADHAMFPKRN